MSPPDFVKALGTQTEMPFTSISRNASELGGSPGTRINLRNLCNLRIPHFYAGIAYNLLQSRQLSASSRKSLCVIGGSVVQRAWPSRRLAARPH